MDPSILHTIQEGYGTDDFCKKLIATAPSTQGIHATNGLWYIGDRLLIPRCGTIREDLFRLAHNTSGHFSTDKSYVTSVTLTTGLSNLEKAYTPSCTRCLCNKSSTHKPTGPLHPLPIPDTQGDSVAMDFIRPLPLNKNFDCILSMMD